MGTTEIIGTILGSLVTLGGVVLVFIRGRKSDKAGNVITERRDTIADRDGLIDQLQEDVISLRTDIENQKRETTALRKEVSEVRDHNNALTTYCYRLIAVIRTHGHLDDIPVPPPNGIHL